MKQTYWITAIDKPAFFVAMLRFLASSDTQIAFEGNLSNCDFSKFDQLPASGETAFVDKKVISDKNSSRVILALTENNITPIIKEVLPNARIVHEIEHIQIQKKGELQLLVGDSFHNECISVGPLITKDFLTNLKTDGVIRFFETPEEIKARLKHKYPWLNS